MAKKKKRRTVQKPKARNFVAKNAQSSGAGTHKDKVGKKANRQQQKKDWKKAEGLLPCFRASGTQSPQ